MTSILKANTTRQPGVSHRAHVVVVSFTDIATDPRVNRQVRFLHPEFRVTAIGCGDPQIDGVRYLSLDKPRLGKLVRLLGAAKRFARRFDMYYNSFRVVRSLESHLADLQADAFVVNDVDPLPAVLRNSKGAKVLLDAHEYAPGEFGDLRFRIMYGSYRKWLAYTFIPRVDAMFTVSPGLVEAYHEETGVRPELLLSAPNFVPLDPSPVDPAKIRLVHHDLAVRRRRLEALFEAMALLDDRYELHLALVPTEPDYLEHLKSLAEGDPRIFIHPPAPMRELPEFLNPFDIGVLTHPEQTPQARFVLPNKFFEFIQARLALAIGPSSPAMDAILRKHDLGVIGEDLSGAALAKAIAAIDPDDIRRYKRNADRAAHALSAEASMPVLVKRVRSMVGGPR